MWVGLLVVVGLALAVGSGALETGKPAPLSLYQRTLQVAGQYRCPVCADESAAVSDAPAAVEIRDQIRAWLQRGWTQQEIRSALVHDYGASILERPPATGAGALVWVLPSVAAAAALAGLGLAFVRWRRLPAGLVRSATDGRTADLCAAEGQVAGVVAEAELGQGRLFDLAFVPEEEPPTAVVPVNGEPVTTARAGGGPWARRAMLVAGTALVALAGALWVFDHTTSPGAGSQATNGGSTSITAELEQAASVARKDPVSALVIYEEVLKQDPAQPVALASEGWIYAQGGYTGTGLALLQEAEKADPGYAPPHLYRGLVLLDQAGRPAAALGEIEWYLHHGPVPAEVRVARAALARAEAEVAPRNK